MTPRTRLAALLIWLAVSLPLFGCQRDDQSFGTPAPTGSSVQIVSTSPSTGQPLRAGENVKLKVNVNYTLTVESGTLALVVQSADNSAVAENFEVVKKGNGKITLEAEFTVPRTKAIQIFIPLSAQGQNSTSTVDTRAFEVIAN